MRGLHELEEELDIRIKKLTDLLASDTLSDSYKDDIRKVIKLTTEYKKWLREQWNSDDAEKN